MPFTPKPHVPYYPVWVEGGEDYVAICADEHSANAVAYAHGAIFDRQETCHHGMSAWLCEDPISHYPRDM